MRVKRTDFFDLFKHSFDFDFSTKNFSISVDTETVARRSVDELTEYIMKSFGSNIQREIAKNMAEQLKAQANIQQLVKKEEPMPETKPIPEQYKLPFIVVSSRESIELAKRVSEAMGYGFYPVEAFCADGIFYQTMTRELPEAEIVSNFPPSGKQEFKLVLQRIYKDLAEIDRAEEYSEGDLHDLMDYVVENMQEF